MASPGLDNITNLLGTFLDVQSRRAEVVAGNLANVDTPGFKAKEVDFDEFLRNAAREALTPGSNQSQTLTPAPPSIVEQDALTIGIDGNTVDSAREMASLAEAGGKYVTGSQLLQMRFRTLRMAIREGR